MTKLVFYIALIVLALSCSSNSTDVTKKKRLRFIENYSFYSGFQSGNSQIEILNGKEYFCVGDFYSHKKIAVHSLADTSTFFIDLSQITDLGEHVMAYEIINLDSIMILTTVTNRVYFIHQTGAIFHKIDFNEELNGVYELRRSSTPFQYNDTSLIFSLGYHGLNTSFKTDEGIKKYSKERLDAKQILKVDNFNSDPVITHFVIPNIRARFMTPDDLQAEGSGFSFDNKFIFHSNYSDSIYLIDPITFELDAIAPIKSKYTQAFIQPVGYNEYKLVNKNVISNGRIDKVLYDENLELYYCLILHKPRENDWPWSIIVLDNNLKKMDEFLMDGTKYSSFAFITKEGLLISNYYETVNDTDFYLKNTMTLFRYE
tara:strand:- start:39062 stop:40177 length:1116 start_codon:yes stop_codon:yes gene_type:complete